MYRSTDHTTIVEAGQKAVVWATTITTTAVAKKQISVAIEIMLWKLSNIKQTPKRNILVPKIWVKAQDKIEKGIFGCITQSLSNVTVIMTVYYGRNITFSILSCAFTHILGTKMLVFGVCFILYFIYIILYYTTLHCTALPFTALYYIILYYIILYYIIKVIGRYWI